MDDIKIRYSFTLEDGSREVFELTLDVGTLELKNATPAELPPWTELGFHQCPNCPLRPETEPHCPAAAHLVNVTRGFERVLSFERVQVEVATIDRTITQEMAMLEKGVSVKPAYCCIWSTRPESMIAEVTTPCSSRDAAGVRVSPRVRDKNWRGRKSRPSA